MDAAGIGGIGVAIGVCYYVGRVKGVPDLNFVNDVTGSGLVYGSLKHLMASFLFKN